MSQSKKLKSREEKQACPTTVTQAILQTIWHTRWRYPFLLGLIAIIAFSTLWPIFGEELKNLLPIMDVSQGYDFSKFEVADRQVTLHLAQTRKVPQHLKDKKLSPTILFVSMKVRRVSGDAKMFLREIFTSGLPPDAVCLTHSSRLEALPYTPNSGRQKLSKYGLFIDVSTAPVDSIFDLQYQIIYWNAFQGETGDWMGDLIANPTKRVQYTLIFPPDRPFKKYQLFEYPMGGSKVERFLSAPDVTVDANNVELSWFVNEPKLKYCYRIDWSW